MLPLLLVLLVATSSATVWPLPSTFSFGSDVPLCTPFKFTQTGNPSSILTAAFTRYNALIFGTAYSKPLTSACVGSLAVTVTDTSGNLSLKTDESYSLSVTSNTATINAKTVFGALRGLETFSQLVSDNASGSFTVTTATVSDSPRFPWRGLMIDTARHYLSVNTIMKLLDAMSYSKLNVLHWHLVDAESFPLVVPEWPLLSQAGAWTPKSVYTPEQITKIVAAGLERGIRVVPEVDMPGHAYSWGIGYPYSVASCPSYAHNINNIPLNPANNSVYTMVQGVVNQLVSTFGDNYLHLGGDEVVYGCWLQDPSIQRYMKQHHLATANDLMKEFISRVQALTTQKQRSTVYWEEVFLSGAPLGSSDIIQVWKDEATLLSVARAGVKGLLSYGWYLDHGVESDWTAFYNNEPFNSGSWTPKEQQVILGGEVAAWAERVNDYNFEQIVWPRTAAAAERLWSPRTVSDTSAAQPRLVEHICRLNARGVAAGPIIPNACK